MLLLRVGAILFILLISFIIDRICRKAVIPMISRIADKTEFRWDDYLLGNDVLNDACRVIGPVIVYAFALTNFILVVI